jgi:uncharacterized protein (DUF58 family)
MNQPDSNDNITTISAQALIRLRRVADQLPLQSGRIRARQGGDYQSAFKGRGMEFVESRVYLPGDDIRNMDWRVTARTGTAHTKVFAEERERPVLIWLDLNDAMFFATRGAYKAVVATQAATLIAWSAAQRNDHLGALVFAGEEHIELKPRRGKAAVLDFIGQTCKHSAWQQRARAARDMDHAMLRLRKVARPGSMIFLFSDFRDFAGNTLNGAARSALINLARHNDVILVHHYDAMETDLPPPGRYRFSNGEHELELNSANQTLRQRYQQRFIEHQQALNKLCQQHRMYLLSLSTQDNVLQGLQQGLGLHAAQRHHHVQSQP